MDADEVVRIDEAVKALHRLSVLLVTPDSIVCCEAADLIESLHAQLAESQRRERAAVEDIEKMMRICEKGSCHFCADGDCTNSPYCEPKWRGPRDAGKGAAE